MKALMIGVFLIAAVVAQIEEKKKKRSPGDRGPPVVSGESEPGHRFVIEVEFSRVWENSVRIRRFVRSRTRPRSKPSTDELDELVKMFESGELQTDPLHVACRFECMALSPRDWRVVVEAVRVFYRDVARGPARSPSSRRDGSWAISSKTRDRVRLATAVIRDVALAWRFPLATAEENSVLESQLVAAALVFLEERQLKVKFDPLRRELSFPDLDDVLTEVLPDDFPLAAFDRVIWFVHEALVRGVGPGSGALDPAGRFTFRGVPYEAHKTRKTRDGPRILARAQLKRPRSGFALRESALLDGRTGRVVEARGIVVYAPRLGDTRRFGATRWHVKRTEQEGSREE